MASHAGDQARAAIGWKNPERAPGIRYVSEIIGITYKFPAFR